MHDGIIIIIFFSFWTVCYPSTDVCVVVAEMDMNTSKIYSLKGVVRAQF